MPHTLSHTGILRDLNGLAFTSDEALEALELIHIVLSFAAGRWIGMTLFEGEDFNGHRVWWRWGTTPLSPPTKTDSWFDRDHTEWLTDLPNSLLALQADDEASETFRTAFYWYIRSNTQGAGLDGSLILTQCALELLSWFVIVRWRRALSEDGYGQLSNVAERLRLTLSLLGLPTALPTKLATLRRLAPQMKDVWKTGDLADAIVGARNYLVHPTQSRRGKRRSKTELPWYELWQAGQYILELVLLRVIQYSGHFQNRTRINDFHRIEVFPSESSRLGGW